jgi:hypothetical protein
MIGRVQILQVGRLASASAGAVVKVESGTGAPLRDGGIHDFAFVRFAYAVNKTIAPQAHKNLCQFGAVSSDHFFCQLQLGINHGTPPANLPDLLSRRSEGQSLW